jgi:hypothetical protein
MISANITTTCCGNVCKELSKRISLLRDIYTILEKILIDTSFLICKLDFYFITKNKSIKI